MSFTIKGIHPHDIATILDDDEVLELGIIVVKFYMINSEFQFQQELQLEFITAKILMFYVFINKCKKVFQI